ncbi:MAG: hypothetical protein GX685_05355 [Clostridiales bacterium]|nr:hypothetical protein [Clostridiales bacterium]
MIGVSVNRAGGINGLLLLITAICGVSGLAASIYVINALNASSKLSDPRFYVMLAVIAAAFIISMILFAVCVLNKDNRKSLIAVFFTCKEIKQQHRTIFKSPLK